MRFLIFFLLVCSFNSYGSDSIPDYVQKKLSSLNVEEQLDFLSSESFKIREADTDLALLLAEKGLKIAEDFSKYHYISVFNSYIGVYYLHLYYLPRKSLPYFHIALETAFANNDSERVAYAYNNLADVFLQIHNIPIALDYTNKSIKIFEDLKDLKGIAYGFINLGHIYRDDKNYEASLESFERSLELHTTLNDANGIAYSILEIGRSSVYLEQFDTATTNLLKALQLHKESGNLVYQAFCYDALGQIEYRKNNIVEALDYYFTALELNKRRNYQLGLINNNIGIALCYSKQGKISLGEKYIGEAEMISEDIGIPNKLTEVHRAHVEFYKNTGNFEVATDRLLKFVSTYDAMMADLMEDTFRETGVHVTAEIQLNEATKDLETQQREGMYLNVITLLSFVILFVIWWKYRGNLKLNLALQKTVKEKEKLFSIIAHDLKSPFNSIIGFSNLLVEKVQNKELTGVEKYAEIISKSSLNAMKLLEDLTTWSNAETGTMVFNPQELDINQIISDTEKLLASSFELKSILFYKNIPSDLKIVADKAMISTVFRNLISNAIKFTHKNGAIHLNVEQDKNKLTFSIKDDGVGIPKEVLPKLFIFSESVSTRGTDNEKGTGLGLILCKEFVEKHGGKIWVESEEGEGSTFYFTLPI